MNFQKRNFGLKKQNWIQEKVFCLLFSFFLLTGYQGFSLVITSVDSDEWSEPDTWDSGTVPGINDTVVINGHSINLFANVQCRLLRIVGNGGNTGNLTIINGYTLTVLGDIELESVSNGMARIRNRGTLTVHGNIHFNADIADNAQINMNYTNNPTLNIRGNLILNSDGKIIIGSSNPATYHLNGTTAQTLTSTSDIQYYHIRINNSSAAGVTLDGDLSGASKALGNITIERGLFDNAGYAVEGNDSTFEIRNNCRYVMKGSTTWPSSFNLSLLSGSIVEFAGDDKTITLPPNDQDYHHLVLGGTGIKTIADTLVIAGNFTMGAGLFSVDADTFPIFLTGNMVSNGGDFSSGTVVFNGSSNQTISGSLEAQLFDMSIQKTNGSKIILSTNLEIANHLSFGSGNIETGQYIVIVNNNASDAISGFSDTSYVAGTLRRYIDLNDESYAFPVGFGADTSYFRADYVNNFMDGVTYLEVKVDTLSHHNDEDLNVSDSIVYNGLRNEAIWRIEPNEHPAGGSYGVRLYTANFGGILDNEFAPLKRPDNSTSAADWTHGGGQLNPAGGAGRMAADGYAYRFGLTSFSQFGIGTQGNMMPIDLLLFSGKVEDGFALLEWATATEINNEFFQIERSLDGARFNEVGQVKGAGNSFHVNNYSLTDNQPLNDVTYYRLKQVDFDGTFTYSHIIALEPGTKMNSGILSVYPNPVFAGERVQVEFSGSEIVSLSLIDLVNGREVLVIQSPGSSFKMPKQIVPGIYGLRIRTTLEEQFTRLIVKE